MLSQLWVASALFEYGTDAFGTPGVLLRLNYAAELRYGVLLDIGLKVFERRPST